MNTILSCVLFNSKQRVLDEPTKFSLFRCAFSVSANNVYLRKVGGATGSESAVHPPSDGGVPPAICAAPPANASSETASAKRKASAPTADEAVSKQAKVAAPTEAAAQAGASGGAAANAAAAPMAKGQEHAPIKPADPRQTGLRAFFTKKA